ncbi:MAG TPA: GDP-L-fucose synthase [Xanthomonadales bacterium]|nr:GDP-L-fucose synthase [Xanthomonadales bacterium]
MANRKNAPPRIFVAGHKGMVGAALVRALVRSGNCELVLRGRRELDLSRQSEVEQFFGDEKIDQVFLAAARVGGIQANNEYPADFIRDNLLIQTHVIDAAYRSKVDRLLFLGSSCIYPRLATQPMRENALLSGELEPTNEAYAIAKIAGLKMCEAYHRQHGSDFRSVMPTNLYGPLDNFDLETSHVLPALLHKFYRAVRDASDHVMVWGSGKPRREFLHVDDMAAACLVMMSIPAEKFWQQVPPRNSHVNIGCGEDVAIAELAQMIARVAGFQGEVRFDSTRPDGTPRKLLDVSLARSLGWSASIPLQEGLQTTYDWMVNDMAGTNREV